MNGLFTEGLTDQQIQILVRKTCEFVKYVDDFYGIDGVYPMNATRNQICDAIIVLIQKIGDQVQFDSIDRESVREILIEQFGLKFPTPTPKPTPKVDDRLVGRWNDRLNR